MIREKCAPENLALFVFVTMIVCVLSSCGGSGGGNHGSTSNPAAPGTAASTSTVRVTEAHPSDESTIQRRQYAYTTLEVEPIRDCWMEADFIDAAGNVVSGSGGPLAAGTPVEIKDQTYFDRPGKVTLGVRLIAGTQVEEFPELLTYYVQ
jgi:hypothetical protein